MCGTRITSIYEDGNETSRYSVGSWHAVLFDKSPREEPFEGTSRDILFWLVSHPAATMIFKMMIQSPVGASRKKKGVQISYMSLKALSPSCSSLSLEYNIPVGCCASRCDDFAVLYRTAVISGLCSSLKQDRIRFDSSDMPRNPCRNPCTRLTVQWD